MTNRLLDHAARLSEADYQSQPGFGHGSIHDILFHVLGADQGWRVGLETGQQPARLNRGDYPTLEALREGFKLEQTAWQALLDKLSNEAIEDLVTVTSRRGAVFAIPRWRILQHLVLHGMQHHAELAQLLTANGQSPGDIDFIFYD